MTGRPSTSVRSSRTVGRPGAQAHCAGEHACPPQRGHQRARAFQYRSLHGGIGLGAGRALDGGAADHDVVPARDHVGQAGGVVLVETPSRGGRDRPGGRPGPAPGRRCRRRAARPSRARRPPRRGPRADREAGRRGRGRRSLRRRGRRRAGTGDSGPCARPAACSGCRRPCRAGARRPRPAGVRERQHPPEVGLRGAVDDRSRSQAHAGRRIGGQLGEHGQRRRRPPQHSLGRSRP